QARSEARERLADYGSRVRVAEANFSDLTSLVNANVDFLEGDEVVGVLMDLGVSSHQLDQSERGFSFRFDAPLDMRMNPTSGETAAEFLMHVSTHDLAALLRRNGETRFAGSIAKCIIERQPRTTFELSEAVQRAVPAGARRRGHVATRVFQALRIVVNNEEDELSRGLESALNVLAVGGVLAVISYHSGEDRTVKAFFADQQSGGCQCPKDLGCVCGAVRRVEVFKASARLASASEVARNPRARSARLRSATKVAP
ncbi:MAG: 16S rRNA (cytosine(1402)-N(4))-methyltransferase RsmH, partial [Acidimicrobiales bacterium]